MKTENAPEEKAKFFAQYWGQNVQYYTTNGIDYPFQVNENFTEALGISYLLLTPLKNITDEDAIDVAKIVGWVSGTDANEYKKWIISFFGDRFFGDRFSTVPELPIYISLQLLDFLRSKSYLLPYKDLSTKDLIAYGWAKES